MTSVLEAFENYYSHCQFEKNLSRLTLRAYRQDIHQFIRWVGMKYDVERVSKSELQAYIKDLFNRKLKETSIKRKVASLKVFFKFLEMENYIQSSPFHKLDVRIKIPRRIPKYLSLQDVRLILSAAKPAAPASRETNPISPVSMDVRNGLAALQSTAIVEILFSTGLRVSELCSLNVDDIDLDKKVVKVFGKGSRERTVVITNGDLLEILARYLRMRNGTSGAESALLINKFGRRMKPHSVRALVKKLSRRANLQRATTPHMFRHTIATLLLENGVDIRFVQKFLGHSSIMTTQMYTHLSTSAEREIIATRHPRNMI